MAKQSEGQCRARWFRLSARVTMSNPFQYGLRKCLIPFAPKCKKSNIFIFETTRGGTAVKKRQTSISHLEKATNWQPNCHEIHTPRGKRFRNVNRAEAAFCASSEYILNQFKYNSCLCDLVLGSDGWWENVVVCLFASRGFLTS